ncbi:MAG: hypothetical protein ACTSQ8_24140 [Candidatus Helarchaeota archaeon]
MYRIDVFNETFLGVNLSKRIKNMLNAKINQRLGVKTMKEIQDAIELFINMVRSGEIEVYNEISVQHEIGIILRSLLPKKFKIQFERPLEYFELSKRNFIKREIDITIFSHDLRTKIAIEMKFPRSGQYPEQMFSSCKDVLFLEQLCKMGFVTGYFLMLADDPLFYGGNKVDGIYSFFRGRVPIHGSISKPTGIKNEVLNIVGSYPVLWKSIIGKLKYFSLPIGA